MSYDPTKDVIDQAREKICSLQRERNDRAGGGHPDPRVALEIAEYHNALGRRQAVFIAANERMRSAIASNLEKINQIDQLYDALDTEYTIANQRHRRRTP